MSRTDAPTSPGSEGPTRRLDAGGARPHGNGEQFAPSALVLARYRLEEQLGVGAFGVVWRARDERLERDVAVKAIGGEHAAPGRATREARAAARLSHPAIVTLYEAGSEGGTTYLVSELVRGGTLAQLLREGALSDRDVAEIGIALCAGLAHAHAQGVVHRDVKPSNVLVPDARGTGEAAAKLTDFGVARVVGAGGDALTRTGDVVGTLAYMAPEQAEGREAEAPADLYAAALVLYEALSGVNPVRAGSAVATARKLGATLPRLQRQRRDLPAQLCAAIDRALLPHPKDRGTVAQLSRALSAALKHLDDEPGTIDAPAIERAATAVTQIADATRRGWRRRSNEQELAEVAAELGALNGWTVEDRRGPGADRRGAWRPGVAYADRAGGAGEDDFRDPARGNRLAPRQDPPASPIRAPLITGHVLPGMAAGGLVALALSTLGTGPPPVRPLLAGVLAAAVVGLLPRIGWIATAAVVLGWLAGDAGQPGVALVLACALAVPPLLLPLRGRAWSLPFAAPLLGVALLAGAYPTLAGQARTLWRRAALGALGFWVLALAEPVLDRALFYGSPRGTAPGAAWHGSLDAAVTHVLRPLLASGALACAGLWAAAAAILPWLVRGRTAALDLVAATVWAAGLAFGAGAIGDALGPGAVPRPDPRGAALGAAAAVLIAVAARAARGAVGPARESDPPVLP
ncbi:MAG TPA: serine/threonine-protein kinase [Conexibacter sp.]|nr:serine/threonine-protein kinase [Conexibacter sp.]